MVSPTESGPGGPNFCRRVPATPRRGCGRRPSAAPHRISRILSGPDVESVPPVRRFWVLRLFSPTGDGTGSFSYFSCRTARGVSIPARGVHGFLLRPFYALVGTSGSRRSVSRSHRYRAQSRTASPRGGLLAAFRSLACVVTTATRRAFGPRVIRTRIRPLRERSAHRTRIETGRKDRLQTAYSLPSGRTQACHAHLASAENRSPEAGRTEQMAVWTLRPASEGHLTGVGRPV